MHARCNLSGLADLQTAIRASAAEIEKTRRLPEHLVDELVEAGCYRLFTPRWKTGKAPDYKAALLIFEALGEADGSVGWTASQCALAQVIMGYLPRSTLETIYSSGPDLMAAGAFAPKGHATRSEAGWRVTGRWPLVTGCELADWLYLQCFELENRRIALNGEHLPATRLAVFPARDVEILDTWNALGLRGTGSHDVQVQNRICADAWTCSLAARDRTGKGVQAIPLADHAGLFVAAVAVGIAAGAVGDVKDIAASGKRPAFGRFRLTDDPVFQCRLGEAYMRLQAARALLYAQAGLVERAIGGTALSPLDRSSLRATCGAVMELAVAVTDAAHALARSSSVWESSPLPRRLRDIHTASQHAWNSWDSLQDVGRNLLSAGSERT